MKRLTISFALAISILGPCAIRAQTAPAAPESFKFSFGSAPVPGYTRVTPNMVYTDARGYGFDIGGPNPTAIGVDSDQPLHSGCLTAGAPFFFSVRVPEGNYRVTVTLGNPAEEAVTTVKAELRRLMLEQVRTDKGQYVTRTFAVNVRRRQIAAINGIQPGEVRLKGRELQTTYGGEAWAWDDKLTLEFSGKPAVAAVEIQPADDLTTVYLCGDSTVCDQPAEPFNSWGQMITRFLKPNVAVCNHAESGETAAAFYGERRMDKLLTTLKAGDYVFVQFGHNDMKQAGALPRYKELYTRFVSETRARGATPVIMTPVSRETFDAAGKITNSFIPAGTTDDFPAAVRQVAVEQKCALIDLQNISARFYETLGNGKAQVAFATTAERTHHSDYGSYQIAKCVLQAIIDNKIPLAASIVDDWQPFDPAKPDPIDAFKLPHDPMPGQIQTPIGN